jgi:hypothetical protein
MVPKPKATIRKALLNMVPVEIEEAIAIYTKPHGKKPFNTPIYK